MGDARFDEAYERVAASEDRTRVLRTLRDVEVLHALAGASRGGDPYLANVLATEALNRHRRLAALFAAVALGAGFVIGVRTILLVFFAVDLHDWEDHAQLAVTTAALIAGGLVAFLAYVRARRAAD